MTCTQGGSAQYVTKDPDATLDYDTDWTTWMATGDTIATSEWIVPAGLTITDETHTDTAAVVWLSGGALGDPTYTVVNRIVTVQGRTEDREKFVTIQQH